MKSDDIRLKKIGRRGRIEIWTVDGSRIRGEIEKEFTNFGHHFRFAFIPENEFWIDQEAVPDERRFFIDHLLTDWRLIKRGMKPSLAAELAEVKERSERERSGDYRKIFSQDGEVRVKKVHRRLLRKIKGGFCVWLVDGRLVRSVFKISFTEGGHDLVYQFVPENEVWIDNDLVGEEREYVILHELFERQLMQRGKTYPQAHRQASQLEWKMRRQPKELKKKLASLGWRS